MNAIYFSGGWASSAHHHYHCAQLAPHGKHTCMSRCLPSPAPYAPSLPTPPPSSSTPLQPPEVKAACLAAAEHCSSQGIDIASLALKFSLQNPDIATTLVGMAAKEVVRANVEAALQVGRLGGGSRQRHRRRCLNVRCAVASLTVPCRAVPCRAMLLSASFCDMPSRASD